MCTPTAAAPTSADLRLQVWSRPIGKEKSAERMGKRKKVWEYDTWGSRVIPDLSTDRACSCLTSQIGRDTVFSTKYDRTQDSAMPSHFPLVFHFPFDF